MELSAPAIKERQLSDNVTTLIEKPRFVRDGEIFITAQIKKIVSEKLFTQLQNSTLIDYIRGDQDRFHLEFPEYFRTESSVTLIYPQEQADRLKPLRSAPVEAIHQLARFLVATNRSHATGREFQYDPDHQTLLMTTPLVKKVLRPGERNNPSLWEQYYMGALSSEQMEVFKSEIEKMKENPPKGYDPKTLRPDLQGLLKDKPQPNKKSSLLK